MLGGSNEDILRMRGKYCQDGTYNRIIASILEIGGMEAKLMAEFGTRDNFEIGNLGGKVLGVEYDVREDLIHVVINRTFQNVKHPKAGMVGDYTSMTAEKL